MGGSMSEANLTMSEHGAGLSEGRAFSIPTKKLVMWLFIISDAMTFAAVLVAYGFLRNATPNWPTPFKFDPSIMNVIVMTFILISSSLTMLIAMRAAQAADRAKTLNWMLITAAAGTIFVLLHLREWSGMIAEGVRLFQNPWGTGLFGAAFFSVTGLHLLHVTVGVLALVIVGLRFKNGRYDADDIEITGLYWHFVDIVWMFVVPLVYLLSIAH
jgi:cytochrome c oxidase subunit 3